MDPRLREDDRKEEREGLRDFVITTICVGIMNINFSNKKIIFAPAATFLILLACAGFFYALTPVGAQKGDAPPVFEIRSGEGFREVSRDLYQAGFIRSSVGFDILLLVSGRAGALKPGDYQLTRAMGAPAIEDVLTSNSALQPVTVTVPEGSNIYEIDKILSDALVIHRGDLINFHADGNLEGRLFPDTYQFFTGMPVAAVVQKFLDDFNAKAEPVLGFNDAQCASDAVCEKNLILASIIEKEVPDPEDQKIVAGILLKRLAAGMRLQVDATVCYAKMMAAPLSESGCSPLTPLDLKIDSPYNSYLYGGMPPGPIGNPGVLSIEAAMHPESSPYWFYISDPKTKKTIFAKTLQEQDRNAATFL